MRACDDPNTMRLVHSLSLLGKGAPAAWPAVVVMIALAGCGGSTQHHHRALAPAPGPTPLPHPDLGHGSRSAVNIYRADGAGDLSPAVRGDPALVYVPNRLSGAVDVISQQTSYDLRTLYVDNDLGNSLTPINPRTGRPGRPIPVETDCAYGPSPGPTH